MHNGLPAARRIALRTLAGICGCIWLAIFLIDAFNTIVLARRTERTFRVSRYVYRFGWSIHTWIARRISSGRTREHFLGTFGPFSLLALLAEWAASFIVAFGSLQWAVGLVVPTGPASFVYSLYFSGSSLFTVVAVEPVNSVSRLLMVIEAGLGIGFLGLVVGYLPMLYQSFSSREMHTAMLDSRAGSPPTAQLLLSRRACRAERLEDDLANWEEWAAEILESHLSYPMLAYFRSQHPNQSWLSSLTAILDASAVVAVCSQDDLRAQARLTFAAARHAMVDLARIFCHGPSRLARPRLPADAREQLRGSLRHANVALDLDCLAGPELDRLIDLYEPYASALSDYFMIALPAWIPGPRQNENWLAAGWEAPDELFAVSDPFSK